MRKVIFRLLIFKIVNLIYIGPLWLNGPKIKERSTLQVDKYLHVTKRPLS